MCSPSQSLYRERAREREKDTDTDSLSLSLSLSLSHTHTHTHKPGGRQRRRRARQRGLAHLSLKNISSATRRCEPRRLWVSELRVWDLRVHVWVFGFRVSDFEFRVLHLGALSVAFHVSGYDARDTKGARCLRVQKLTHSRQKVTERDSAVTARRRARQRGLAPNPYRGTSLMRNAPPPLGPP